MANDYVPPATSFEELESRNDPIAALSAYRDLLLRLFPSQEQLNPLQQAVERLSGSVGAAANQPSPLQQFGRGAGNVLSGLVNAPPASVPGVSLEEMNQRLTTTPNIPSPHPGELVGNTLGSIINALNREHGARLTREGEQVGSLQRRTIQDVAGGRGGDLNDPAVLQRLSIILGGKPSYDPLKAETSLERAKLQSEARKTNVQAVLGQRDFAQLTRDLLPKYKTEFFQKWRQLQSSDQTSPEAAQLISDLQDIGARSQEEKVRLDRQKTLGKQESQESGRIQRRETALNVVLTPEERNALKKANVGYTAEDLGGDEEALSQHEALVESANAKLTAGTEKRLAGIDKRMEKIDADIKAQTDRTEISRAALRQRGLIFQNQQDFREFQAFYRAKLGENMQSAAFEFRKQLQQDKGEAFVKALEKLKQGEGQGGGFLQGMFGAIGAMLGYSQTAPQGGKAPEIGPADVEKSITEQTYDDAVREYRSFKQSNPGVDINEAIKPTEQPVTKAAPAKATPKPNAAVPGTAPTEEADAERRLREKYGLSP